MDTIKITYSHYAFCIDASLGTARFRGGETADIIIAPENIREWNESGGYDYRLVMRGKNSRGHAAIISLYKKGAVIEATFDQLKEAQKWADENLHYKRESCGGTFWLSSDKTPLTADSPYAIKA